MHDTEYAYGVARIRANELSLFTPADLEQLITSFDFKEALRILEEKGWHTPEAGTDINEMLEHQMISTWQLISEAIPDIGELKSLIIANDFHNLKAAMKTMPTKDLASKYSIEPSVIAPGIINEAISVKEYMLLPEYMRKTAEDAYDAIVRLDNGRLADIIIDTAALNTRIAFAKESGCELLIELAQFLGASANIKTAVRCVKSGKSAEFMTAAMCFSGIFDNEKLIEAALTGEAELTAFLSVSFSEQAAERLASSTASFEKWVDETTAEKVQSARFEAFGLEPFAAYYINKEMDVKNTRIILSAKLNNINNEMIRTRVREINA